MPFFRISIISLLFIPLISACSFPKPLTANAGQALIEGANTLQGTSSPQELFTPAPCTILPGTQGGRFIANRLIDLDPSIPQDSKPGYVFLTRDGEVIEVLYSAQAQIDAYLQELGGAVCTLANYLPACITDDPSAQTRCTVPTSSALGIYTAMKPNIEPTLAPTLRAVSRTPSPPAVLVRTMAATATLGLAYPPPAGSPTAYPPP